MKFHKFHKSFLYGPVRGKRNADYGEFRSGKTTRAAIKICGIVDRWPDSNGAIIRNTHPDLIKSTVPQFSRVYEQFHPWNFNKTNKILELEGKGNIFFIALDREDDAKKLKNIELGWFWIDQAEEINQAIFEMAEGRMSQLPNYGLITGNPEGKGWDYYTFYAKPYKVDTGSFKPACPKGEDIPAKILDYGIYHGERGEKYVGYLPPPFLNEKNLPVENYYFNQIKNKSQQYVDKYIYRLFVGNAGLVHADYNESQHVIRPVDYNLVDLKLKMYVMYESMDYGVSNPTCWLFVCHDIVNDVIIFMDEYYADGGPVHVHGPKVQKIQLDFARPVVTVGCPKAFQTERDGKTPADEYLTQYRLRLTEFKIGIEARSEIVNRRFKQGRIKIYERCVNLRKQIESATWKNIETMENHALEPFQRIVAYIDTQGRRRTGNEKDLREETNRSLTSGLLNQQF